jgi:hypothetical protein
MLQNDSKGAESVLQVHSSQIAQEMQNLVIMTDTSSWFTNCSKNAKSSLIQVHGSQVALQMEKLVIITVLF